MSKKRIGNTTDSIRNTEKISKFNKMYSEEIAEYKRYAVARREARRKYTQEKVDIFYEKLKEYVADRMNSRKPMTIAGICLALGVNGDYWQKAKEGEYDYLLDEYIDDHNITDDDITYIDDLPYHLTTDESGHECRVLLIPHGILVEKAQMMVQNQLEENLYTNKGNPAGSIFSLKHNYGWREDDQPQHVVNQLVIADSEQAKKAMQMLTNG